MQLFEVIRWGNDSDDPVTGGPDGPDTCFLVRAAALEQAVAAVDRELVILRRFSTTENGALLATWAQAVYLLGTEDDVGGSDGRILRGPYVQHAYRHGWRHWYRAAPTAPWVEQAPSEG